MGYLKIITAILIWSSLGIFIRKIDLPNHCIIFYTAAVAGVLQFILLASTGLLKKAKQRDAGSGTAVLLVVSPLCFIANSLLFYFAFRNTTIANAVLTHYTAPVFVAILAPIVLKEKILGTTWIAIILSSVGLWFIMSGKGAEPALARGSAEHLGIIAGALSGLAYAFLIMIVRKIAPLYSSLFITFIQSGIVTLVLAPFAYATPLPPRYIPYLLAMGVLHSTIAPLLYVQGFRSVRANEAAILGYFEPIGATILALVFLDEKPVVNALIGGALILYSGYMILKARVT